MTLGREKDEQKHLIRQWTNIKCMENRNKVFGCVWEQQKKTKRWNVQDWSKQQNRLRLELRLKYKWECMQKIQPANVVAGLRNRTITNK